MIAWPVDERSTSGATTSTSPNSGPRLGQRRQARAVDAVVVRHQDAHAGSRANARPASDTRVLRTRSCTAAAHETRRVENRAGAQRRRGRRRLDGRPVADDRPSWPPGDRGRAPVRRPRAARARPARSGRRCRRRRHDRGDGRGARPAGLDHAPRRAADGHGQQHRAQPRRADRDRRRHRRVATRHGTAVRSRRRHRTVGRAPDDREPRRRAGDTRASW